MGSVRDQHNRVHCGREPDGQYIVICQCGHVTRDRNRLRARNAWYTVHLADEIAAHNRRHGEVGQADLAANRPVTLQPVTPLHKMGSRT